MFFCCGARINIDGGESFYDCLQVQRWRLFGCFQLSNRESYLCTQRMVTFGLHNFNKMRILSCGPMRHTAEMNMGFGCFQKLRKKTSWFFLKTRGCSFWLFQHVCAVFKKCSFGVFCGAKSKCFLLQNHANGHPTRIEDELPQDYVPPNVSHTVLFCFPNFVLDSSNCNH